MVGLVFGVFLEKFLLITLHQSLTFTMLLKGKGSNLGLMAEPKSLATTHQMRDDCLSVEKQTPFYLIDAAPY